MLNFLTYFFINFSFCLLAIYFLGIFIFNLKKRKRDLSKKEKFNLSQISVVIPFRNEEENLPKLIQSFKKNQKRPLEFIFVNDHSEDNSLHILKKLVEEDSFIVINLAENEIGKKTALRKGILTSSGKYILSLDADITLPQNYFDQLSKIIKTDLLLMPVKMKGRNFLSFFAELDFYYLNNISLAFSSFIKPISASGANMLFNKEKFEFYLQNEKENKLINGEDMFILKSFKKQKAKIRISDNKNLIVTTKTPNSWQEIINQRLRWISKTGKVEDKTANIIAGIGFIHHFGLILIWVLLSFNVYVLILKILIDILCFVPYLIKIKRVLLVVFLPFFSLFYLGYIFQIIYLSFIRKPVWKGRLV
jgi:cellulose synthase/poly-beta-1,6-N-acetylglucosamine synthase-like glycosyltransferase